MTRISLKEAYDNRDVIAQIARLNDIVADLPNPDLTNCVLKTGNQIIDGVKQFNDQVVLAGGMDLSGLGPTTINGDLEVNGDIIQSGAAYETHAEQIFSHNDYIVMRDGAVNSLPAGSFSGLQVKKYNGSDDVRMVVDNTGIMRVGDINDERPLLVRDEAADLSSGDVLLWDSSNQKAIGQAKDSAPTSGSNACVTSGGIFDALALKLAIDDLKIVFHGSVSPCTAVQSINVGNILIQFGKVTTNDTDTTTINLPIAYPDTSYITIMSQTTNATGQPQYLNGCCVTSRATNSFTIYNASNGTNSFNWLAIGRNTV